MEWAVGLYFVAAFLCAMGMGGVLFPKIILISKRKRILDRPNGRKVHVSKNSSSGRFGILSRYPDRLLGDARFTISVRFPFSGIACGRDALLFLQVSP